MACAAAALIVVSPAMSSVRAVSSNVDRIGSFAGRGAV
jgi:hypothetical protein